MRKTLVIMAPALVIAAGIAGFLALHATKPTPESTSQGPRPLALFVEEVRRQPVSLTVTTQGEVRPRTEINLVAQVGGRIVSVAPNFVEGGIVDAGETLISIEDADYRFEVVRAEARVAEARLKLAQEEAGADVVRRQWQWDELQDKGEPTALALKEPHVAEARAKLRAAEADLAAARLDLERTQIKVPFGARVRSTSADRGQYVSAGTTLGQVFSTEIVNIRLPLTDAQLGKLGLPVAFSSIDGAGPPVTLTAVVGGQPRQWRGRIVRTDAAIDRDTRLLYAIAEVEAPYGAAADNGTPLAVGLFVTARIEGRNLADAYVIPRAALRSNDNVFVVLEDNTLDIRPVAVVSSDTDRVVLHGGVKEGERVVVSPVRAPANGLKVEPIDRSSGAALAVFSQ